ncbi:hypothetical protein DOY81_014402 [Sarcophaga bullata]|nr:hypothetical protein DOY81_014402 [Sarcophaga bullata]
MALTLTVINYPFRYLAVYHSQLPLDVSHHHFSRGEVQPVYYIFSPWNNATYKLGSKSSLVLEDYFKTPSEFFEMCEDDENK